MWLGFQCSLSLVISYKVHSREIVVVVGLSFKGLIVINDERSKNVVRFVRFISIRFLVSCHRPVLCLVTHTLNLFRVNRLLTRL